MLTSHRLAGGKLLLSMALPLRMRVTYNNVEVKEADGGNGL